MISENKYHKIVEKFGQQFCDNPGNYVTEADLQFQLVNSLLNNIDRSTVDLTPQLNPTSEYKQPYLDEIADRLDANGFSPVHTEMSFDKNERFDVGVISSTRPEIQWDGGSKKFETDDVEALFELKFVKNQKYPPTNTGFEPSNEQNKDYTQKELREKIDWDHIANSIKSDAEALGRRPSVNYRAVIVFSNYNYYHYRPTEEEVDWDQLYKKLGDAAWSELACTAYDNGVDVLYVTPEVPDGNCDSCGGMEWIHKAG